MLLIDPMKQTTKENYKLLIGAIAPRPIAFVTSIADDGTINGAPFSYFNIVSANPPMISVSVQRKGSTQKDTAHNILQRKDFVVHIVDEKNVMKVNETAASLAPTESELDRANLTMVTSKKVETPGVKEAKVRFECKLVQHIELGNGETITTDFIIGIIVQIHVSREVYNKGKIRYEKLNTVGRLAGNDYAQLGSIFSLERPD